MLRSRTAPLPPEIPYSKLALAGWRRYPSKTAVIDVLHNEELTFAQLEERVLQVAGRLQKAGIRNQVKVQFFCENSLSALVAMQAALFCNATLSFCNLDEAAKYREYKEDTDEAESKYIITDCDRYERLVRKYLDEPQDSQPTRALLVDRGSLADLHTNAAFIDDLEDGTFVEPQVRVKEDVLILIYTSGSTGRPKGVMHSHYSYIAALKTLHYIGICNDTHRFFQTSSLNYVSGVIFPSGTLAHSGTVLLADHTIDHDYPRYVETYKPTVTLLMELHARNVVLSASRYPDAVQMLRSFRLLLPSGTIHPEPLQKAIKATFPAAKFAQIYGMTESIGPIIASDPQSDFSTRIGYPAANMTVRLVNENGDLVKVGEQGEILFKGPQRTLGYWKRVSEDFTEDGFYKSGDIGVIDEDGEITLLGRNKHFITCLDARVAPIEIENVLLEHPQVAEAIVVGIPHPEYQQAPTALVVPKYDGSMISKEKLRSELIDLVAARLSTYRQLHGGVFFANSLSKTTSGKYAREAIARTVQQLVDA